MKIFKLAALTILATIPATAQPIGRINLKAWYDGYNEEYFLDQLPKATVGYHDTDGTTMAYTFRGEGGYNIVISPVLNPTPGEVKITLLHEMCHVATWRNWDFDAHGQHWKDCMHRLADAGAFDLLW